MTRFSLSAAAYCALAVLCFMAALALPFPLSLVLIVGFVAADLLLTGGGAPRRRRVSDERAARIMLYPQEGRSSRIARDDRELLRSREVAP